ncbi:MAG: sugar phosphate isomerase/epimerase family protein [Armatimonadota bacterium]|nr:sugar phosphate isomerase/epimerase family protein [Armatimonadota bacterium]
MKTALCTIAFRERLLEYSLDIACEGGLDGVEIWGREPHISEEYDANRVEAARRMVADRGLKVAVFGSYVCLGATERDSTPLRDALQIAAGLDAPVIRVWASDVGSDEADEDIWKQTVEECAGAAAAAEKMGMRLAAEMHNNTLADTGESARRLVDEVGSDHFGLNYQAAPSLNGEAALERLEHVVPDVFHLHAQNYGPLNGDPERVERVALADGVINYAPLIDRLRQSGYGGYVAVEFSPSNCEDKRAAVLRDCMYLRNL